MGMERAEDAGVYKITENLAIVQTLDFFTPVVDDPYAFGQIAAANAFSDVYAMGGRPLTAMNIVCFPVGKMDIGILKQILLGGLDKIHEAGAAMVGGHSVDDQELKYGLSVTGIINPELAVRNCGARAGDLLILTKPLGTGIINTAIKGGLAEEDIIERTVSYMSKLNRTASALMMEVGVNACTDVTGFGLIGHACEMIEGTDLGMVIKYRRVPLLPGVREFAVMGLVPGGTYRNRDFRSDMVIAEDIPEEMMLILFDAQTSGGLLISLPAEKADILMKKLQDERITDSSVIGEVVTEPKEKILVSREY